MNEKQVKRHLDIEFPQVKWEVSTLADHEFYIVGSYKLAAIFPLLVEAATPTLIDEIGMGFYSDLSRKLTNFKDEKGKKRYE